MQIACAKQVRKLSACWGSFDLCKRICPAWVGMDAGLGYICAWVLQLQLCIVCPNAVRCGTTRVPFPYRVESMCGSISVSGFHYFASPFCVFLCSVFRSRFSVLGSSALIGPSVGQRCHILSNSSNYDLVSSVWIGRYVVPARHKPQTTIT